MTAHTLADLSFDDRFVRSLPGDPVTDNFVRQVSDAVWSPVTPTSVASPKLVAWAPEVGALLGLSEEAAADPAFAEVLAGNRVLDGMRPYAARYGGHQFGHWAGQLGDGRAITLGEVVSDAGRFELQLKGAGPTPYSRSADGRAVLRSSVREFLCSEAMHHLGVPTTRALSLVTTGDDVLRDMFYDGNRKMEPGAVVCRVAPTFLRFGSTQILAARGEEDLLRALVDDTITTHFPELGAPSVDTYTAWLSEIARRTALMIVHWMRVGFVHGVMNTDNMSVLGVTIDYGPYGWLDDFDPNWTPNTTDASNRRYRFGYQPRIALWNLVRFAESLYPLVGSSEPLEAALEAYADTFEAEHRTMLAHKIGLDALEDDADVALANDLLATLQRAETDMTLFYRRLADLPLDAPNPDFFADVFYGPLSDDVAAAWKEWLGRYVARVAGIDVDVRKQRMNRVNPKYVLRNYIAQLAIDDAEKGDFGKVNELLDVLRNPYDEQPEHEQWAAKRPEWARHRPGCSQLSCSS